ncbi:hypothetical protein EVAR_103655_1 [Eumeta japonica]|uniref:Uncharacterized protein n=1 Tax=Eumeta variegata TaxID=151549 RepID=A0A4C1Z6C9_EUMVA|nr:hypothetical protein EVAR_103655_1 [Eumeta japonica]
MHPLTVSEITIPQHETAHTQSTPTLQAEPELTFTTQSLCIVPGDRSRFFQELVDTIYKTKDNQLKLETWLHPFSPCERDGEGGEKPLMGRPCARAHRCVRLAQTKNLLNNVNLQWREQNAITPSFKKRPYGMEMPSARDCPMGALRVTPRHRRSRETYSTDCKFRGDSGGAGSAPD